MAKDALKPLRSCADFAFLKKINLTCFWQLPKLDFDIESAKKPMAFSFILPGAPQAPPQALHCRPFRPFYLRLGAFASN